MTEAPIRICLINGSSRSSGQTAGVLNNIRNELEDRGARASVIHLRNVKLAACDGTQTPRLRPDFKQLFGRLTEANGIIFATPTYWFNMSGLMKNFLHRLTVVERGWPLEGRVAGFIATAVA
jgi:multimeric flavodoxin WrbA